MAKNNNLQDFLTDIANSIRTKKGTTGTINAQNFSSEIASIETTGITPTGSIDITSNGTVDVTNYASANVNVANQNPYTAANSTEMAQYLASKYYGSVVKYTGTTGTYTQNRLYKVIQVTSNEYAFEELITPVGSTTKTENGTYDVKEYAEVVVNVPSGGGNTLKNLLDATKQTGYLFHGYMGTSVDDLIQYSDTENVTKMNNMFFSATNLTTIPLLDTSKVTNMSNMFSNCFKLTSVPLLNTSNVTSMDNTFANCWVLTSIPQLDTSKVTNMTYTFEGCKALTTVPLLDTSKVTNMYYMFHNCQALTSIPQLNTGNVTNMYGMFNSCSNLTTVPALDVSKVTNFSGMFYNCSNLKSILMTNIGVNLDISASTKFERSDLLVILNNLKTVTSTQKLTMGATNLAKLTDEDKAIATGKGWTLA